MTKVHKPYVIFEDKDHKFVWLGLDESEYEKGILTNQYLIVDGDKGVLLDPGGYFVFERVYENVKQFINPNNIIAILYSHQDPDVIGSLNLWLDVSPEAKIYVSALWERFLPHIGVGGIKIVDIPDKGMDIKCNNIMIKAIPAHFMHSPGNFHYYDPRAKIYFSGDLGAAVFPEGKWYLFVENFDEHKKLMEGFHKRYIATRKAIDLWLKRIKDLKIDIIAPQHGSIFQGENVKKFIDWLSSLDKVGIDLMEVDFQQE
ncbi:MBL fold metallo-hydrolase [Sulfolobus sp. A20]|uniref:MBL fold metallo-hydrolase n=1 Tax=Saccharolobus sp. A20 TaxID=1891280 RepID=UPI000845D4DC|nr:MBL fold metallo-hydrolase [Sulfolobus sp. A20]TRM75436.1 MBL fold metallo-hydrolase [Sulfolobus sp. B5]TRM77703.1 MBL fold metallo-hydrolase [Sulfolobus sp. A20-N-F8]TRM81915.1 MBL fold metallo-hydrolase [Sulfolobus sp. D5]TRM86621.1 MBL fold metallo-hydrolase [Sulfolobus sp. E3]TRM87620.1 MBL fold metallo-hydrolase [Sulfolobus sp. C3]TRM90460.1 MBL fold metallo-hydrolase [Sulfolobus sp. A20-N-G8]TRN00983.1 MBL fold metallo-hydrolase [Sulfolobus sp. F1]TRN03381.1 MBL fold metallo-hydrol